VHSSLLSCGEVPNVHDLTRFFGCGVEYLPSSYLGLPLGASYKSIAVWDPVVKRFHKNWQAESVSFCLEGVD